MIRPLLMDCVRSCVFALLACSLALACGEPASSTETASASSSASSFVAKDLLDSVALAHGYDHWAQVDAVSFDFVVSTADTVRSQRTWQWYPRTDSVVLEAPDQETVRYRRAQLSQIGEDDPVVQADRAFINDTYWLLMPYYLVWSREGFDASIARNVQMPLSGEPATRVTIQYQREGGYTPGDAYDLFVDGDLMLREWAFRRAGTAEPNLVTSWEGYSDMNGIKVPARHEAPGGALLITHGEVNVQVARR